MFTVTLGALGGVSQSIANSVLSIAQAAANYWDRYIDTSLASIDIQIDFTNLGGTTLAQAGTDYYFAFSQGGLDYFDPATVIELTSGIDENGANPDIPIEVDIASINANDFNFGPLVDGVSIGGGAYDLWTVLVHEIAHGLGLLTFLDSGGTDRTSFDRYVTQSGGGYNFDGPDPNFGPIALDDSIAHFADNSGSILDPTISPNIAVYLTARDLSVFGDIGAPLKRPTSGDDSLSSFGTTSNSVSPNPDLHALAGNDTLVGLPTADRLFGDEGNDSLYGGNGSDSLDGGEGADTLRGDVGADTLNGGNGVDTADLTAAASGVSVNLATGAGAGSFGNDVFVSIEIVMGGSFGDTIAGSAAAESLIGGAGGDFISADSGADTLNGGDNGDTLNGGIGDDFILGGAGNDSIGGDAGVDSIDAGAGYDTVDGGDNNDNVFGGNGGDSLMGGAGNDTLSGAVGKDALLGGDGADILLGGDTGDALDGGLLNDWLYGEAGSDTLNGGDGDDFIIADSGRDSVTGGVGDDSADAGAGDDTLSGQTGRDDFFGGSGADVISGGGGNDTLQGGDDNDRLTGDDGFDALLGGEGDDLLDGGDSSDILFGNGGADTFAFAPDASTDTIRDLEAGSGLADVIMLQGYGAAFDTFTEVLAAASDNGVDTTIDFGGGDILVIRNVLVGELAADDFAFG